MKEIQRARRNTLGDILRRSRGRFPQKIALRFGNEALTYEQLDILANQAAHMILASGLQKGDRAAVLSRNSMDFVILNFALARAGVIMVPINYMLNADDVAFILGHADVKAIFASQEFHPVADEAIRRSGCSPVLRCSISEKTEQANDWGHFRTQLAQSSTEEPELELEDDDVVHILYTSGTESRPKGVMLTHKSVLTEYVSTIIDGGMTEDDVAIHALPLFHSAQLHCFLGPYVYLGASGIILEQAQPALLLKTVEEYKATQLFCPPTVWIALLRSPEFAERDLSSLKKCYYGAAIMPVEILKELGRRLPNAQFWNFYGQTEVAPLATVLKPADQIRKAGSAGRPSLNVETRIVDDSGQDVPRGTVGEIVHRTSHAMLGYFRDEEKTSAAFQGGWFHSGDLGVMDEEGYITVVDRKKDMIKSGGENVASREVEEVIYQHPLVSEVAVIGIPDPYWIEAVAAVVVPKAGEALTAEELLDFCKARLSAFKAPKHIVLAENLPRNPSGKILKRELRAKYESLASQQS
ncbi:MULTISPECIES: acyl-CoA synthetase [Brevibacillus]|uniref:Acyl-CoA synthetase n=1 Tax=Brevibacillus borstelensis AK1 TaxID=1300222 RepID=M8E3R1_9BACL|nr:acyl-CoA synthetase [Brevibacillus borstelensis]EMT53926.1 acyl-CoA synthetase [Brevibacillus borstelensis AK1]MBE5394709.1 acyl-CoA synthetase [Brevibacillus borstelensis]MED1882913.1 acyl-CoA synthetase [Brevibacillus borstelensis]RNB65985.1 long-chain-fatty-acid--CoA ligase [Brevibacillus borstelensis]GED53061.1 acyl-CoA synthetase [Brevibacillus borstelensis]